MSTGVIFILGKGVSPILASGVKSTWPQGSSEPGFSNNQSISDIWKNSSDVLALRNLTLNDFPKCKNCEDKEYCSICLIRNVNESEYLDCKDVNPYFCAIAKIRRQIMSK